MKKLLLTIFAVVIFAAPAMAMCSHEGHSMKHMDHAMKMSHSGPPMANMAKSKKTKADKDLYAVSLKMHKAMDVALINTPDADFARAMIPHHQGAIDMAEVVLKYGSDEKLRSFAQNIIRAQKGEIGWMKRWLKRADQPLDVPTGNNAMEKSANTPQKQALLHIHHGMHAAMDVKLTGNADADFVRAMIPHHQGAVDMSYWLLTNGRNPDMQDFGRHIIKAQRAEIAWMKNWLKKNGVE